MCTPPTIPWAVGARPFVFFTTVSFFTTIGTSYYLCAFTTFRTNPHCSAGLTHLPVISNTWVYAPENYLSRWCVGMFCGCLAVCQFFIYWINESPSAARRAPVSSGSGASLPKVTCSNQFLLGMSLFAVFCLSWVGAICESTVPSCRGNITLHTGFAITFFALYDIYMIVLNCREAPAGRHPLRTLCVAASIVSKTRWLPSLLGAVGDIDWDLLEVGG